MLNIQEYLNQFYPQSTKNKVEYLSIGKNSYFDDYGGHLDLSDFASLKFLDCSHHSLSSLDLSKNLELNTVIISGNEISADLSIFSHLTKLERLDLGTRYREFEPYEAKILIKNNFTGSLKSLQNCKQLKHLRIGQQTNITEGLEYLPSDNLITFECENTIWEKELKPYNCDIQAWKLVKHPELFTDLVAKLTDKIRQTKLEIAEVKQNDIIRVGEIETQKKRLKDQLLHRQHEGENWKKIDADIRWSTLNIEELKIKLLSSQTSQEEIIDRLRNKLTILETTLEPLIIKEETEREKETLFNFTYCDNKRIEGKIYRIFMGSYDLELITLFITKNHPIFTTIPKLKRTDGYDFAVFKRPRTLRTWFYEAGDKIFEMKRVGKERDSQQLEEYILNEWYEKGKIIEPTFNELKSFSEIDQEVEYTLSELLNIYEIKIKKYQCSKCNQEFSIIYLQQGKFCNACWNWKTQKKVEEEKVKEILQKREEEFLKFPTKWDNLEKKLRKDIFSFVFEEQPIKRWNEYWTNARKAITSFQNWEQLFRHRFVEWISGQRLDGTGVLENNIFIKLTKPPETSEKKKKLEKWTKVASEFSKI